MNDEVLENENTDVVEQATEKLVDSEKNTEEKTYTQAEIDKLVNEKVDSILPGKIERAKNKLRRENQEELNQYRRIENILSAGLGTNNPSEIEEKLKIFYQEQGVQISNEEKLSRNDLEILASAEAEEIINSGFDDVVEETERLAAKGTKNMSDREKIVFTKLAAERKKQESIKELEKSGISLEAIQDKDYQEFAKNLNPAMSEKDKYEMYTKYKPKTKKVEPLGSMKTAETKNNGVKDFYTPEEARRFTRKELDENPALYKAICDSMTKWGK